MRIIAGDLKGRMFSVPSGFPSRPTTDYAKEGLFNLLGNQTDYESMTILDLCSGTGNIGFEFISRGAEKVTCVDKNDRVVSWLNKNAQTLGIRSKMDIIKSDCLHYLDRVNIQYDLIFADPPFDLQIHALIAAKIFERNLLKPEGMLIIEHGKQTSLKDETNYLKTRNFGNVNFSFFQ